MISFGLCSQRESLDLVVVDQLIVVAHAVCDGVEPLAGHVDRARRASGGRRARGSCREGVARLQQREEHRLVGLRAGMRLHVGERRSRTAAWRDRCASCSATSTYSQPP